MLSQYHILLVGNISCYPLGLTIIILSKFCYTCKQCSDAAYFTALSTVVERSSVRTKYN